MEVFLEQISGVWIYFVVLAFLIATGFGLPLSEDFLLMIIGYLVYNGNIELAGGALVAFAGCLIGDFIMFNIGYHYGEAVRKHRFVLRVISHGRQERILEKFRRYGDKFIIFARFVAGVRAPTFLTAGISQMNPLRFVLLDGFASLFSVPLFVGLGYAFAEQLASLQEDITHVRRVILLIVLAGIGLYVLARYMNLFWQGPDDEDEPLS